MASLKDVAQKANVSITTVSRVINNNKNVNPDTRRIVLKAVKELDFRPSKFAQRLRVKSGKRKLVGLIVPDIQNPFYVDVVRGVEDMVYANDYAVIMCNFAQDEKKASLYIDIMRAEGVDGLIIAPTIHIVGKIKELIKNALPIVLIDRGIPGIDVDMVEVDNRKGASNAVELLISKGHKRIAYIGGIKEIPTSKLRHQGYLDAHKKYKIKVDKDLIEFGNSKSESGRIISEKLLSKKNRPTALFCGNNLITLGALETIHNLGLKIPSDVAIVGFDDMPWSISLNPPLTAIFQPGYEIGRSAVRMLLDRIDEPNKTCAKVTLKTQLIERKTT
ncbi:MAG: LacI family DNA-binding transcriptional regulator [Ignavibacteriae bacterium]|nr:LacI family DNA-binding transcriptional regulator [Ignavibacteriota bacterium]